MDYYTINTFDWKYYIEQHTDLTNAGILTRKSAWNHWQSYGNQENRKHRSIVEEKSAEQAKAAELTKAVEINIITFTNIKCSTSENATLLKTYLESKGNTVNIIDTKKVNTVYDSNHNIICIQPFDVHERALSMFKYKPTALWVWEFKSLPSKFKKMEKYFSKILTVSQFCLDIFSKNLSLPIEKIELKSQIHNYIDKLPNHKIQSKNINSILSKTKNKIKYGYCFDLNSCIIRKNVLNLVKAFKTLNDTDKVLILKSRPTRNRQLELNITNEIKHIVSSCSNIYLIIEQTAILDLYKLYTHFHYYISPHCGEGFGLTIYDNMILGNKIISPYYSGETDYLDRSKIIELEYEEKEIDGLNKHPIYGQMNSFKGAYISVESILKGIHN
jgi:hypothetical protein